MTIKICPNCQQRFVVDPHVTDFVHECNSGNKAIDEEDVLVVGNWEDFSGSGTKSAQAVLMQGAQNELFGERAAIKGFNEEAHTDRGARAPTRRQRQHFEFIELDDKRNC